MTVVLKDYDVCFLHCPKTGGLWIKAALENAGVETVSCSCVSFVYKGHAPRDALTKKCKSYFTFVRSPLAWYSSWWKFFYSVEGCERERWTPMAKRLWHPAHTLRPLMSPDFDEFIYNIVTEVPGHLTWMFEAYAGARSRPKVQYVGRTETLVDDLVTILNELNVSYDEEKLRNTPVVNQSNCRLDDPKWDDSLKARVLELESEVTDRFYSGISITSD